MVARRFAYRAGRVQRERQISLANEQDDGGGASGHRERRRLAGGGFARSESGQASGLQIERYRPAQGCRRNNRWSGVWLRSATSRLVAEGHPAAVFDRRFVRERA